MVYLFQVTFTEEELPKTCGDFILGFYSNNMNTIVGVTEPFQVMIAEREKRVNLLDSGSPGCM